MFKNIWFNGIYWNTYVQFSASDMILTERNCLQQSEKCRLQHKLQNKLFSAQLDVLCRLLHQKNVVCSIFHALCCIREAFCLLYNRKMQSGVLKTWLPLLHQTWVSYEIPVLVEPLEDANDFFILAESRLASKDPRLPFCEKKNYVFFKKR